MSWAAGHKTDRARAGGSATQRAVWCLLPTALARHVGPRQCLQPCMPRFQLPPDFCMQQHTCSVACCCCHTHSHGHKYSTWEKGCLLYTRQHTPNPLNTRQLQRQQAHTHTYTVSLPPLFPSIPCDAAHCDMQGVVLRSVYVCVYACVPACREAHTATQHCDAAALFLCHHHIREWHLSLHPAVPTLLPAVKKAPHPTHAAMQCESQLGTKAAHHPQRCVR